MHTRTLSKRYMHTYKELEIKTPSPHTQPPPSWEFTEVRSHTHSLHPPGNSQKCIHTHTQPPPTWEFTVVRSPFLQVGVVSAVILDGRAARVCLPGSLGDRGEGYIYGHVVEAVGRRELGGFG